MCTTKDQFSVAKHFPSKYGIVHNSFLSVLVAHVSVLVALDCNPAIGGQGQSGCTWTVCHGSSSELQISVCIMLNDVDTHKYHGLANCPPLVCASGIMTGHLAMSVLFG